jgi:hypothetical protein
MTPNAKRYIILDEQYHNNDKKAEKFESGYHYNPIKGYAWREKANTSLNKQNELTLSDTDKDQIEQYYQCGQMFDR